MTDEQKNEVDGLIGDYKAVGMAIIVNEHTVLPSMDEEERIIKEKKLEIRKKMRKSILIM